MIITKQGLKSYRRAMRERLFGKTEVDKRVAPGAKGLTRVFERSLSEAIEGLTPKPGKAIVVFGDQAFFDAGLKALVQADLERDSITWVSASYADLEAGAQPLAAVDFSACDGVLVGGSMLKSIYPQLLRHLTHRLGPELRLPIAWAGGPFEWCFGSMAFPLEARDADVFLFHHWDAFAGMKDQILAKIEFFDETRSLFTHRIMAPNETLYLRLNDHLPGREGPSGILVETYHPRLIGRRNHRWRLWGDVTTDRSLTSLHGCHHAGMGGNKSEFIVDVAQVHTDRVTITLPNYDLKLPDDDAQVRFKLGDENPNSASEQVHPRNTAARLEQMSFDLSKDRSSEQSRMRVGYRGYGGSFWYTFHNSGETDNICANHSVGTPFGGLPDPDGTDDPYLLQLQKNGIVIWPYPLPVTNADDPVEFGFNFLCSQPRLTQYAVYLIGSAGEALDTFDLEHDGQSHIMSNDILNQVDERFRDRTRLLMIVPDWERERKGPRDVRTDGLLIARHRRTGDYDATEYQNAWRNVGLTVPKLRHWLIDTMMLTGRTNVMGRFNPRTDFKHGVLVINASAARSYATTANVSIQVIASTGHSIAAPVTVAPQSYNLVWLEDLFPDIRDRFNKAPATILVRSADADCNSHMVTIRDDAAVSLQHLWGY